MEFPPYMFCMFVVLVSVEIIRGSDQLRTIFMNTCNGMVNFTIYVYYRDDQVCFVCAHQKPQITFR